MGDVARVGQDKFSTAIITSPGETTVQVNGKPISVVGDTIAAHGKPPHTNPTVQTGLNTVKAGGKEITVSGISIATCTHKCSAGSPNVKAG